MLIQKLDIKAPLIPKISINNRLTKSNSSSQLSIKESTHKYELPFIPNDSKIKKESVQLSYLNSFDMRNIISSKDFTLKYKPKRFIISKQKGNPKTESSFIDFRYMPLNENKVFKLDFNKNDDNLIKISEKKSDEFYDEDFLRLNNYSFKSNCLLKLGKNIKEFDIIKQNSHLITPNKLGVYNDIIYRLSKIMKEQINNYEENLMKLDINKENNETLLKKNFENLIKREVASSCDFNFLMNKLISFLFEEIHSEKEKNFKLLQKNHEEELIINSKSKSLKEINSYINRYDVDTKLNYMKNQEKKNKLIKEAFIIKQNEYLNKIYNLEKEIEIMANLLNKNKIYYNKCKEYEEKIDLNKKEIDEMKILYKREIREKNTLFKEEVTKKEELREELTNIKKVVDNLKKEKKDNKNIDIISKSTIEKLKNMINERNENIMMINEELEYYLRQNYNLKKQLKDKEFSVVTLGMKIKIDKEKENILNSGDNDSINVNNLKEGQI